jgi:hypothetical protein
MPLATAASTPVPVSTVAIPRADELSAPVPVSDATTGVSVDTRLSHTSDHEPHE